MESEAEVRMNISNEEGMRKKKEIYNIFFMDISMHLVVTNIKFPKRFKINLYSKISWEGY